MEQTIAEAMQRAVAAHKKGKLQEAERLYRVILQSQPLHPDVNHNLGLIAISVNQKEAALPLFKTALNVNPNIEQFWVSYIDALVKAKRLKDAKQAIIKAKKKGFDAKKLQALLSQLKGVIVTKEPSQEQLSTLLEHYKKGRFTVAEKLAKSITQEFSKHQFGWKVLGSLLKQTGRISESLVAIQKCVQLVPQDAEAHFNLGNTLQELNRLVEAEASYTQAIALKPDYALAYNNLCNTLQKLSRLDEAEASCRQAIALKPDLAEAHSNLGITFQGLGKLDEAKASYRQAIALKPDYAEAHNNLGSALRELGRLDEAAACYRQAIALKPEYSSANHMLAASTGKTTATAPRDYVEGLFDSYATKFEDSLIHNLEYMTPRLLAEIIIEDNKSDLLGSITDLGCGTGLFGVEINQFCGHLEGIDLSEKMLTEARKKSIYSRLLKQDIIEYLLYASLNFDYFVSVDVFVYIGDLSEVFRLIKSRNKKGGILAFSTENYDGDGFFLEQSGRYSHSKQYIEGLCEKFGYELSHFEIQTLRKEKNQNIRGGLYLLNF